MPRYDKYDEYDGGFRGILASAITEADAFKVFAVGLDVDGHVVKGAGQSGIKGVLIAHGAKRAGAPVDVMTDGEIVEFVTAAGAAAAAGTSYFGVNADGTYNTTNTGVALGFTAENSRLIVRVAR